MVTIWETAPTLDSLRAFAQDRWGDASIADREFERQVKREAALQAKVQEAREAELAEQELRDDFADACADKRELERERELFGMRWKAREAELVEQGFDYAEQMELERERELFSQRWTARYQEVNARISHIRSDLDWGRGWRTELPVGHVCDRCTYNFD